MNNEIPVIKAFQDAGFEVIKGGWPDLLVEKDGKLRFIEIKGNGDKLSVKQIRVHELLHSHGIVVEVVKPQIGPRVGGKSSLKSLVWPMRKTSSP